MSPLPAAATATNDDDRPPDSTAGTISRSAAGSSTAASPVALPASHDQRGAGWAKIIGNSSDSPCAELSPSSIDDSDKQYSTACSAHHGAASAASSDVKRGSRPAMSEKERCAYRNRLRRLAWSSRRNAAPKAEAAGVVMASIPVSPPGRARAVAVRTETLRANGRAAARD